MIPPYATVMVKMPLAFQVIWKVPELLDWSAPKSM
jgi:hypothetical protein